MPLLSGLKLDARQILIASLPSDLPDSFFCGPSDKNGAALCSDSVVPGPRVRIHQRGDIVYAFGDVFEVKKISKSGVVTLYWFTGGFARFVQAAALAQLEFAPCHVVVA